jgi:hypothetical protein
MVGESVPQGSDYLVLMSYPLEQANPFHSATAIKH